MIYRVIPKGDLDVVDGALVLLGGAPYVAQKMAARFKFFLGEWFLDKREGVPYFRDVFTHNPNLDVIRSVFRQVALSIPSVLSLPRFETVYSPSERSIAFDFQAQLSSGELLIVQPTDQPFIITIKR